MTVGNKNHSKGSRFENTALCITIAISAVVTIPVLYEICDTLFPRVISLTNIRFSDGYDIDAFLILSSHDAGNEVLSHKEKIVRRINEETVKRGILNDMEHEDFWSAERERIEDIIIEVVEEFVTQGEVEDLVLQVRSLKGSR